MTALEYLLAATAALCVVFVLTWRLINGADTIAHLDDPPEYEPPDNDWMAIADLIQRNMHDAIDEITGQHDMDLWSIECGWEQ